MSDSEDLDNENQSENMVEKEKQNIENQKENVKEWPQSASSDKESVEPVKPQNNVKSLDNIKNNDPIQSSIESTKSSIEPPKTLIESTKSSIEPPKTLIESIKSPTEPPKTLIESIKSPTEPPKTLIESIKSPTKSPIENHAVEYPMAEVSMHSSASVDSFAGFQPPPKLTSNTSPTFKSSGINGLSSATFSAHFEEEDENSGSNLLVSASQDQKSKTSVFSFFNKVPNPVNMFTRQFTTNLDSTPRASLVGIYPATISSQPPPQEEGEIQDMGPEEETDAFILARLEAHSRQSSTDPLNVRNSNTWFNELQQGFNTAKASFMGSSTEDNGIDWEFWGKVINDYENVIRLYPRQFQKNLRKGLPEPIRGMMWQLMSNSKNESLEEEYLGLLQRSSRNEKVISRDLARTFPGHEYFKDPKGPGQTGLFNVLKAYSLYDQEIGYCQGIPFVVGPLLLNMPEEQAFCVLVRLMYEYNFRTLYTPKMIGLQLRNHQFDRLLQEQFPDVYQHLERQDIKSTMYASQWFMTLFAYRFPLELVFRILDVIFAEGAEAVLRFALALIKRNAENILKMDFEQLLEYLKNGLFDTYIGNMDQLVTDAATITISKRKLDKWSNEYLEEVRMQSPEVLEAEKAKEQARRLLKSYRHLERDYETLNREHIDLVNKFIQEKGDLESERERNEELHEQVKSLKSVLVNDRNTAEDQVKSEMDLLAQKNLQLIEKNTLLEDTIGDLEQKLVESRTLLMNAENDKELLNIKLNRLLKSTEALSK